MEGPPSLPAAAVVTRRVQRFRVRLYARFSRMAGRDALLRPGPKPGGTPCTQRTTGACRLPRRKTSRRLNRGRRQRRQAPNTAKDASICVSCGLNSSNRLRAQDNLLFSQVATIDSHLPNFDAQQALHLTKVDQARCVLDTTTLLLDQWPRVAGGWAACRQAAGSLGQDAVDDVVWQKSIANLEHMLRCMQHVALVCLLSDLFNAPRWDHRRTRQDGQGCRKNVVEWFTEWVGGCPPLNSTMPWNIKPSLMVLWGVCWMFYPPAGDWAPGQQPVGQGNVPVPNTTAAGYANPSPVSNVSNLQYEASATHPSPNLGNNPQPSPIGRINHPNEPSVFSANPMTQSTNHMITYSDPIHALGSSLPYDQGGASSAFSQVSSETIPVANTLPHNPSVAAPLTSGSSSTPFATAPSQSWRGHAGSFSRPFSRISHHASSIASEPAGDEQDISSATTQFHPSYHDHFPSANPYDPNTYDIAVPTATPSPYQQQHPPPFPPQGFVPGPTQGIRGYAPARRLRTGRDVLSMHSSQSYPSPQHSEASEAASLGPVSMPPEGTPQPQLGGIGSSPSLSRSSRRPSSTNTEPPRNAQGQIYCNHPECAAKPPTFSRKCEWTKHNDKHTRPYVCREPGCEKIRGFTYSGGLLRHQREVHRHHGGPRAPRFCPHPDCKRSSGQGFSRRENLNEHLRRVHRSVGIEEVGAPSPGTQVQQSALPSGLSVNTLTPAPQSQQPAGLGLHTPSTQPPTRKRQRQTHADDSDDDVEAPEMPTPSSLVRHQRQQIERLQATSDQLRNDNQQLLAENQRLRVENQRLQNENQGFRSYLSGASSQHGVAS